MSKIKYTIVFFFFIKTSFCQVFIPLDNDTNEFIESVNYTLFLKNKKVFSGITENKKVTSIHHEIEYDSISLSRVDYEALGLQKENIDSIVYLTKKIIYLNEVVLSSKKDNDVLLGETNRFVKKQSRAITEDIYFGIIHRNELNQRFEIEHVAFFTEKIFYKTAYKIHFYEINETAPRNGNQFAKLGDLIYSTDTLYIDKKNKNKIDVEINSELFIKPANSIFVSIQLLSYLDENNEIVIPPKDNLTKLKFQLSTKTNYYSKTIDLVSKVMSTDFLNINLMINYDFANKFYLKPHKSILVSPAIILYGKYAEN